MKALKKILTIIGISLVVSSCEALLDKDPLDSLTSGQAFATEQNLELYTNGFYQMLPPVPWARKYSGSGVEGWFFNQDVMSDLTGWAFVNTYLTSNFTSRNAQNWTWGNLRNINYFLANYRNNDVPDNIRDHYAGIARFFRAWFYFDKVSFFGDVPWYGEPLEPDSPLLFKGRDSREMVMDSVLADLDFAVAHISDRKDPTSSIITKWVALALKSRICLFEGTFRKYHHELGLASTADSWLEKARDAALSVINSGNYSIYETGSPQSDYRELFTRENPINEEIILARIYNNSLQVWHDGTRFYAVNDGVFLTKRFVNTYLNIDGTRFTDNSDYNSTIFVEEVKNRDYRLSQTIRTPAYTYSDGFKAPINFGRARTGYQVLKFSLDDKLYETLEQNYNSIPIFRYAEVLLNYAEAKAELGEFTSTDWENSIALLRKRAGIQDLSMPTVIDPYMKEQFYSDLNSASLMEIRRERAIELFGEGVRYDDLKRWRQGHLLEREKDGFYVPELNVLMDINEDGRSDVMFVTGSVANPVTGVYYFVINNATLKLSEGDKGRILWQSNAPRLYPDHKYFAPLPFNELVVNPKLEQNDGWDRP
ncbi:RagB/SusD family nutrient uptake outer membrane protein [Parapedobacter soli]|uniref:RagB/SusD family nutrient uptake outer membrane protein n=1 Tax=Parapedobacter soli TaxID=416955 RepID=UPI0021C9DB2B|nr:RagB/SusD family nutrient uptake outer membrane protein [Parapedobacter soli]